MTIVDYGVRRRQLDEEEMYPSSDGKPMGETDFHVRLIAGTIELLSRYFSDRDDVYVAGNNFVYYEEGSRTACVSPDTYVVFGVDPHLRNSFKTWQEGDHTPDVVFEFTSKKTRREDTHTKRPLYEQRLRVPEYFQFDPTADYLRPPLQGMRLIGDEYKPIELVGGRLHSEQLGIEMAANGSSLDFYRADTGEKLLTPTELARDADDERRRADFAERRAHDAERRSEHLTAEIAALTRQLQQKS
jgi:Uma2 family endonuclease